MASDEEFKALEVLFNNFYKYFPPKQVLSKSIATRIVNLKKAEVTKETLHKVNDPESLD
jgi:hypothetical protein